MQNRQTKQCVYAHDGKIHEFCCDFILKIYIFFLNFQTRWRRLISHSQTLKRTQNTNKQRWLPQKYMFFFFHTKECDEIFLCDFFTKFLALRILLPFPCHWAFVEQHDLLPNIPSNPAIPPQYEYLMVLMDRGPSPETIISTFLCVF